VAAIIKRRPIASSHTNTHTHTHTHTHTRTHTHTHTHSHTHTQSVPSFNTHFSIHHLTFRHTPTQHTHTQHTHTQHTPTQDTHSRHPLNTPTQHNQHATFTLTHVSLHVATHTFTHSEVHYLGLSTACCPEKVAQILPNTHYEPRPFVRMHFKTCTHSTHSTHTCTHTGASPMALVYVQTM